MVDEHQNIPETAADTPSDDGTGENYVTPRYLGLRRFWHGCRRPLILCLEGAAMLTGLLVILVIALAWRLSSGPITLDFLTDEIELAVNQAVAPLRVDIEAAAIRWDNDEGWLRLAGRQVKLRREDGRLVGRVPQMDVAFSVPNLLRGRMVVKQATLQRPFIRLTRKLDGEFDVDFTEADAPLSEALAPAEGASTTDDTLNYLLTTLTPDEQGEIPSGLESLSINDARFLFIDRKMGHIIRFDEMSLSVLATEVGLGILGSTRLYASGGRTLLRASGRFDVAAETSDITTSLRIFDADAEALAEIAGAAIPEEVQGLLDSEATVEASYDNDRRTLSLSHVSGQLGDSRFDMNGSLYRVGALWQGSFVTGISRIDVPAVLATIPESVDVGALNWSRENILNGTVENLKIYATGQVSAADVTDWEITDLFGDFGLSDMAVRYQWALPPATDVIGKGRFDRQAVIIDLSEGKIDAVRADNVQVVIDSFDAEFPALVVTGHAVGPFREIMTAMNHPRFGYADYLGLKLDEVKGSVDANMRFALPLKPSLPAEEVEADIRGQLTDVATNPLFAGLPIRDADLSAVVNGDGVVARGTLEAGGIPLSINWHQYFDKDAEVATALDFQGNMSDEHLAALGIKTAPYLTGIIGVDGRVVDYNGGNTDIQATATLDKAQLAIPQLNFAPEPAPGSLLVTVSIKPDDTVAITSASLSSDTISFDASGVFNPDGSYGVRADRLQWGATDLSISFDAGADGGWDAVIDGPRLDLRPLLKEEEAPEVTASAEPADKPDGKSFAWLLDSSAVVSDDSPTRKITYSVQEVITSKGIALSDVRGGVELTPSNWPSVMVQGQLGDAPLVVQISGTRPDPLKVRFESGDLGALLSAYNADIPLIGGRFVFDGTGRPWSRGDVELHGGVDLQDFRLGEAAVLTRTIDALSREGLATINKDAGFGFKQFTADIDLGNGQLTVREGRASGGQFGFTLGGVVDLSKEQLDLNGTLVPVYTLNRWIGAIPVIGTLLTGGDGEGLFAANYTVDGPFSEPDISINPLSALAPGIIRKLLFAQDNLPAKEGEERKPLEPPPGMVDHGG